MPSDLIDLAAGIEGAYAVFARWLVLRASGPRLYTSVEDPRFKWGWIAEAARTCLASEQAKLSDEVQADALAALAYSELARRDKRAFVESAVKYEEKFGRVFPKPQLRDQLDRFLWEDFQEQCDTMLKEGRDAPQARKRLLRTYCEFWSKQDYSEKNSLSTLLQEDDACREAAVSILSDVRVPGKVRGAILFYLARSPFDERERVVVDAALGKLDSSTYLRDVALRCFPLIERRAAQSALVALLRERMARGDDLPWTYAMCVELEAFDCLDLLEQLSRRDADAFQALSQLKGLMGQ